MAKGVYLKVGIFATSVPGFPGLRIVDTLTLFSGLGAQGLGFRDACAWFGG